MKVVLRIILTLLIPSPLGAQGLFSPPDPLQMTASELAAADPNEEARFGGLTHEFDRLGNRLRPLGNITYLIPVSPTLDWSARSVGRNFNSDALIFYKPIVPIQQNPYSMRPSIDVFRKLGPYDFLRPEISIRAQHETNLRLSTGPNQIPDFSISTSPVFKVTNAPDRPSIMDLTFTYQPTIINYFENTQLNTINHDGILRIAYPIRVTTFASATTISMGLQPTSLLGDLSRSESIGQAVSLEYRLTQKTRIRLTASMSMGNLTAAPIDSSLIQPPAESSSQSLNLFWGYTKNEKLSTTLLLGYTEADQGGANIAGFNLGNESTETLSLAQSIIYVHSEKLTLSLGLGGAMTKSNPELGFEPSPYYEALLTYIPHPRWTIITRTGVAIQAANSATGIGTESTFFGGSLKKLVYRRSSLELGFQTIKREAAGNSALLGALGGITSNSYTAVANIPLRQRTTLTFAYEFFQLDSSDLFPVAPRATTSITLNYRL